MHALRRHTEHAALSPQSVVGLSPDHPAIAEGHTLYPGTVVASMDSPRLLVSGINQRKLGSRITKGAWRGMPFYALTLEERATCPRSCLEYTSCYGNAMHFARRHRADAELGDCLTAEVQLLAEKYPDGFVVRLHVLGDFFSPEYVALWETLLRRYPPLHVCGFSARLPGTPIGDGLRILNHAFKGRCRIRFSDVETAVVEQPYANLLMCPAQTGKTDCCGTCGLCWAPAADGRVIGFIKHGKKRRARKQ